MMWNRASATNARVNCPAILLSAWITVCRFLLQGISSRPQLASSFLLSWCVKCRAVRELGQTQTKPSLDACKGGHGQPHTADVVRVKRDVRVERFLFTPGFVHNRPVWEMKKNTIHIKPSFHCRWKRCLLGVYHFLAVIGWNSSMHQPITITQHLAQARFPCLAPIKGLTVGRFVWDCCDSPSYHSWTFCKWTLFGPHSNVRWKDVSTYDRLQMQWKCPLRRCVPLWKSTVCMWLGPWLSVYLREASYITGGSKCSVLCVAGPRMSACLRVVSAFRKLPFA